MLSEALAKESVSRGARQSIKDFKIMKNFYLYILKCFDGFYYVGYTDNLNKRLSQHDAGLADSYTAHRRPVELVAMRIFKTRIEAFRAERKIKNWSRAKKEAFIISDWNKLAELAKKNFNRK